MSAEDLQDDGGSQQQHVNDPEERFQNLEDLPPFEIPYPVLQDADLDHAEAQRILKDEDKRIKAVGVDAFIFDRPANDGLQGPPLSLDECKALVPDSFVRSKLFRQSNPQHQKDPKRKYPPTLSQLQHVNLSKIILERFIEKNKCLPNHNQIPIYFVQHLFCEEFLHKQVNWDDKGAHGGVAMGRPADRKRARTAGIPMERTKPVIYTAAEHANVLANASEGMTLASQGITAVEVLEQLEESRQQIDALRDEITHLRLELEASRAEVQRYRAAHGELLDTPEFNVDDFVQPDVNLGDE